MNFWQQHNLYQYSPIAAPELTFYYMPLSGSKQLDLRTEYHVFPSVHEFMKYIFLQRVLIFSVTHSSKWLIDKELLQHVEKIGPADEKVTQFFAWPLEEIAQEALLDHIPKSVVVELGAVMIGWRKKPDEDLDTYINRIVLDLQSKSIKLLK